MNTTCKHCGADEALHHYQTDQCPVGGREAPVGRKQEWKSTTYEPVSDEVTQLRASLSAAQARVRELEAAVTLTPRKCAHDCYRKGWEAAIEVSCLHVMNEVCKPGDWTTIPDRTISTIRALVPPADCGDCNPLAPDMNIEMCKCGNNPATLPHSCPYKSDINDDSNTLCTCCDECKQNCADDI